METIKPEQMCTAAPIFTMHTQICSLPQLRKTYMRSKDLVPNLSSYLNVTTTLEVSLLVVRVFAFLILLLQ